MNTWIHCMQFIFPWSRFLYYNDILYPNYLSYLTQDDIVQFDFSQLSENLDKVENVMFRLVISNGYPTEAFAQVYSTSESFVTMDSAFAAGPYRVSPAPVNSDGIVTAPYGEIVDVYMSLHLLAIWQIKIYHH